jgi:N-acyl-D-amino-acid deacylase
MNNLLIKNITVLDGTGKTPEILDVAIQGDEIVAIEKNITEPAISIIDGTGKYLSPGFIDLQNHSDSYWQLFDNPSLDSMVSQGFTTLLLGNCGASLAPLLSHKALLSLQKWHSLEGANINWQSFSEFIEQLSKKRFACNIGSLVGYSTLRRGIVGDEVRGLEKEELKSLQKTFQNALDSGAFGISTGLSYSHEIIISELELVEMAKICSKKNALFSVHLRSESTEVAEAVDEALDIAKATDVNLKISHFKIRGKSNWEKLPHILESLETAYHKGMNVNFDAYPFDTISQPLYSYLPKWASEGGRTVMLKHFADPVQKNKILAYLNSLETKFPEMMVASTSNKLNFSGKTVGQIAKNMEVSSEQAVLNIIQNGGSEVLVFDKNLDQDQVNEIISHPLALIGTDGGGFGTYIKDKLVHPRSFGTATKFLRHIIDLGLPIEKEICKLTSAPAKKIGLKKRGEIKLGNFADLVIFDPKNIANNSTYQDPYRFSSGIDYVLVNGKAVLESGKQNQSLPGYVLRKK